MFRSGGFLVLRGIMPGSRTDFHIFQGSPVTDARYCTNVLFPLVSLFEETFVMGPS